jgi:hypothetical protein
MSKNYAKSLRAHSRLFKKACYGPNTLKTNTSYRYHKYCIFETIRQKRCLSEKEKTQVFKEAEEKAHKCGMAAKSL